MRLQRDITKDILCSITLRFREMHFAIATLSFSMLFCTVLNNWNQLGGSGGMVVSYTIPTLPVFPFNLIDGRTYEGLFTIALLTVALMLFGQGVLMRTGLGRAIVSIREDETLAESIGVEVSRYKIVAFVISSIPAGISGIIYPPFLTFIYPQAFGFGLLINTILCVAVGGVGSLTGPVLGGVIFGFLGELLRMAGQLKLAIYGAALIIITLVTPGGLLGWLDTRLHLRRLTKSIAPVSGRGKSSISPT